MPQKVHWVSRDEVMPLVTSLVAPVPVVLDVGCGMRPQDFFRPRLRLCCEPHGEYAERLKTWFRHDPGVVVLNGTGDRVLPLLQDRSVDSVFLIDVMEHIEKEDGRRLLAECERVARRHVVIFTPLGFMPQDYDDGDLDGWGLHGGQWQRHLSGWDPDDLGPSWTVVACREYHLVNGKGEPFDPPHGAFWAIRSCGRPAGRLGVLLPAEGGEGPRGLAALLDESLLPYASVGFAAPRPLPSGGLIPSEMPLLGARSFMEYSSAAAAGPDPGRAWKPGWLNYLARVRGRAAWLRGFLKREGVTEILTQTGGPYDLPVVARAAAEANVPFSVLVTDPEALGGRRSRGHRIAGVLSARALRGAKQVWVSDPALAGRCRDVLGREPVIVDGPPAAFSARALQLLGADTPPPAEPARGAGTRTDPVAVPSAGGPQ